MRSTRQRRFLVAAAVTLLILGVARIASAFWSGGSGSGSADTGTTEAITLSAGTPTAQLYPGGQAGVALTVVSNVNSSSVRVESLALDTTQGTGGFAVDGAHSACGVGSLSFTTQTNGGSGWTIAGGESPSITLPNALSMSAGAAQTCQDAIFTVYLTAGS